MDSKVADFFKEIDALTVPEELIEDAYKNSAIPPEPETVKHSAKKDIASESQCDVSTLGRREAFCPWQEIQDGSSGYSYYWNVNTNEVTWDCPPEYALYVQSAYSGEPNADKKAKKEKKKKESPALPVGAIIPISYYGNSSSSEESSDVEKESSKSSRKEKHAKVSTVKKTKTTKRFSKNKLDEKGSCDVIGPQLPPDFQFPLTIPLSPTHNDSSETVAPRVTEDARDAVLPMSSSNPEQPEESSSNRLVESSAHETVTSTLDKKSNESDKEIVKESLESVLTKEENGLDEKVSHQTTNSVFGLRPVVDYDSFTDEDEEVDASNASPPKDVTTDEIKLESVETELEKEKVVESSCHLFPIIPEQKAETIGAKRKVEETKEPPFKDEPVKKLRKSDVNIDKIFSAHTTYSKHGFGFGWQNQPSTDSDFCLESEPNCRTQKGQLDKTPINFVKSNDVLDLNLLNDDSNLAKSSDTDQEIEEEMPVSAAEVDEKPVTIHEESNIPSESNADINAKDSDSSQAVVLKGEHGDIIINKKKKENTSDEKVAQAVELASLDIEEDIDEIDRALCAALEAKQAAKSSLKASSVPTTDDLKNDCEPSCVKLPVNSTESDNDLEFGNEKERETIFELSTDVIDKLTFLLSNQTALASHNAFLVQLQTRFVDWQAKALDTKYFTARLGEVQDYLRSYEAGIISGDWMCQWDRVNKRYFYVNKATQVAQWTYPEDSSHSEADSPLNSPRHEFLQTACVAATASENPSQKPSFTSISTGRFVSSPPPPPPGVDSPPPLPPHTPPPDRLPPPPLDITTRRDPEDMDLENSNDFSMPFISKKNVGYLDEEDDRGSFPQMQDSPALSPNISSSMTSTFMTGFSDLNAATKLSQSSFADGSDVTNVQWSQSSGAQRNGSESSVSAETSQSAEVDASSHSSSNTSQPDPSRPKTNKPVTPGVKKEKKRKKLQLGIGLKKKNMPSLVEKWLKIKEEQEKEDNDSEILKSDSAL